MRRIINKGKKPVIKIMMFKCDNCGCEWSSDEYKKDWLDRLYDKCPTCSTEIYAKGTFWPEDEEHSHIRKV